MAQAKVTGLSPRAMGTAGKQGKNGMAGAGPWRFLVTSTVTRAALSTPHAFLCLEGWGQAGNSLGTQWVFADGGW